MYLAKNRAQSAGAGFFFPLISANSSRLGASSDEIDEIDEVDEADEANEAATEVSDEDSDLMRVHLEPRQALAFAARALEVVAAGRPPCPFCGQPLNPEGHICARRNGYMH